MDCWTLNTNTIVRTCVCHENFRLELRLCRCWTEIVRTTLRLHVSKRGEKSEGDYYILADVNWNVRG